MTMYRTNYFPGFASVSVLIGSLLAFSANAMEVPELDCVIEPHMVIDLSSRTDGIVETINVERGDVVAAEQVLVQLESRVERAAVEYARVAAEAEADLLAGKVSKNFAQRRHDRIEALYLDNAVSSDQMDEMETEARLSKLNFAQAKERNQLARMELQRAIEVLDRHTLRSPIDGVVVQRFLAPGESVEEKPVLRLAQINPLRVEVIVPVSYFGAFEIGQQAVVSPERPMTDSYNAEVIVVDRVADAASGTFRVRLSLPNPDYKLPSGLNCMVNFLEKPAAPVVQKVSTREPEPVSACQSVGPIDDSERARSLTAALSDSTSSANVREETSRLSKGFVVTSPDKGSPAAAKVLAEQMQAGGFPDLYVFGRGPYKGRVSFGVYNDKASALSRAKEIESAGFAAETRQRHRKVTRYWVDITSSTDLATGQLKLPDNARELLGDLPISSGKCDRTVAAVR
jgi:RND family efflux transporter MFP subunit